MQTLQDRLNEQLGQINESRYEYSVSISTKKGPITVYITPENTRDIKALEEWFEEQLHDTIDHVEGGPNNIEL